MENQACIEKRAVGVRKNDVFIAYLPFGFLFTLRDTFYIAVP